MWTVIHIDWLIDWLIDWCFNGTSTQKGQFVPTAGVGNRLSRLRMANEIQCIIPYVIRQQCNTEIPPIVNTGTERDKILSWRLGVKTIHTVFLKLHVISKSIQCSSNLSKSSCRAAHVGASRTKSSAYGSIYCSRYHQYYIQFLKWRCHVINHLYTMQITLDTKLLLVVGLYHLMHREG